MEAEETSAMTEVETEAPRYLIGVGSSAGGLEALTSLVRNIPEELNASYVIVQHMAPDHRSLLAELIGRETSLPVHEITDGVVPELNHIYVTPPNADVVFGDAALRLIPPDTKRGAPKPSIDRFFNSIAAGVGESAVGVILSGTGTDGAFGIRAIRGAGGITIAQDERSAKYSGMPLAAVQTGLVDLVLSPQQIGTHLGNILTPSRNFDHVKSLGGINIPKDELMAMLLERTQVDFSEYKPATISRRIERRINALGISDQSNYLKYIHEKPAEIDVLFKDLMISVTKFFRDSHEFSALRPLVAKIVEAQSDAPIRLWIAGCATGEEAYSIAMLFAAEMGDDIKGRLQIFATDIDTNALAVGRRGRYSLAALDDIPKELSDKYIELGDDYLEIRHDLRDLIIFSEHNLCQDPPFINIDLISCRNLLIYFNQALQTKVLGRIAYGLKPSGLLFLGPAENITLSTDLFRSVTQDAHIYRKRSMYGQDHAPLLGFGSGTAPSTPTAKRATVAQASVVPEDAELLEELVAALGPDAMLVSDNMKIVRVFGDVSRYLRLTRESRLEFDITVLEPRLAHDARLLMFSSLRRGESRKGQPRRLDGDERHAVTISAHPVKKRSSDESLALLIFKREEVEEEEAEPDLSGMEPSARNWIKALESELMLVREELRQTVKELELSNEQLQSANEELQSSNEELKSTNEELQTSNEELQSTNEELITINDELQISKNQIQMISSDQAAILHGITTPLIVVDPALQIQTMNDPAIEMLGVKRFTDKMYLSQISLPDGFPLLTAVCAEVINKGSARSIEFLREDGGYNIDCSPIFNDNGSMRGVLITAFFLDRTQGAHDKGKFRRD